MDFAVLGVDISKDKFDVALLEGERVTSKEYPNNLAGFKKLGSWLQFRGCNPHVCLEATSFYGHALATYLYENEHRVSMVNPTRIKGFSITELSRTKTDKSDAKMIARFCRALKPSLWQPEAQWQIELKQWNARANNLKAMLVMEKNREPGVCKEVARALRRHIKYIEKEIAKSEAKIKQIIEENSELKEQSKLLESIPGIGTVTTAQLLAFIGDVDRFKSAKQITAYAGLNPRHRQSGTSVRGRTSMSKTGHTRLRRALYMPALVAMKYNPEMREVYDRLVANGKAKKAAIGAIMRKLLVLSYTILKNKTPYKTSSKLEQITT